MRTCTSSWLATVVLFFGEDISDRLKSLVTSASGLLLGASLAPTVGMGVTLTPNHVLPLPLRCQTEAELPEPYFELGTA